MAMACSTEGLIQRSCLFKEVLIRQMLFQSSNNVSSCLFSAIDTVTVYVFHEPSLLSSLQDNGLTGVVMKALVLKDVSTFTHLEYAQGFFDHLRKVDVCVYANANRQFSNFVYTVLYIYYMAICISLIKMDHDS